MERHGAKTQKPSNGITPMQLLGLYTEHQCPELREEILHEWWKDREVFARHIEEAVVRMAKDPRAGLVSTDGRVIDQWNEAFARYPLLWPDLKQEIRQITNATRTNVDRERYSRVVMATTSRCCSWRALQGCAQIQTQVPLDKEPGVTKGGKEMATNGQR